MRIGVERSGERLRPEPLSLRWTTAEDLLAYVVHVGIGHAEPPQRAPDVGNVLLEDALERPVGAGPRATDRGIAAHRA